MAMKLHDGIRLSSSSANLWLPRKSKRTCYSCKNVADSDHLLINWKNSRKRLSRSLSVVHSSSHRCTHLQMGIKKDFVSLRRSRSAGNLLPLASTSADDGVSVNGTQAGSTADVEDIRVKLDRALQDEDSNDGLVQSLHDAARVFELAIKEHSSFSKASWFARAWLGVDRNAWIKTLSYQAAVCSLLQAATEISSRGDHRDRDVNVFVQKSLSRQYAPLESIIRDNLSDKQSDIYEWFWSEQVPAVVTSFVNNFESDPRFTAATSISGKGMSVRPGSASDVALLMLGLTCVAAVTKLGPAKISCSQFFSTVPDIAGRLMDMLVDFISIQQAYKSVKKIGLRREFLVHFGPRAASCRVRTERDAEEVAFWVNLVQKQLQQAIARERIWSRVTTVESIEVLERDLAIFGFFIALGRRTQAFICENGFDVLEDPVEGLIRYLIGGGVLYYPQLASISSYQLYVEVVCEELDWFPLFPGQTNNSKPVHGHKTKRDGPPNGEAIPQALDTCSHWMQSFIKYSKWLENSSNVKAARFLSRGHNKLVNCIEVMGISKAGDISKIATTLQVLPQNEFDSFDKALGSVDEALLKLENLLEELHVSSSSSGKEHLKAACSDLEKIRKLKKEAEFLEASFRAKAASLQQGDDVSQPSVNEQKQSIGKFRNKDSGTAESSKSNSRSIWRIFPRAPAAKADSKFSSQDEYTQQVDEKFGGCEDPEADGIRRFEVLRNELMELENRVQRSANQSEKDEDIQLANVSQRNDIIGETQIVQHVPKKENIIEKSLVKLKSSSRDVWQGTQLLAIDTAAACELIRRSLVGDELTEKEKNALKRTMTDLASVVPIGVLMLLPVTAVGHAAMLAAIQRYFPSLIPSTYGAERLDLLRQLETVQKMEGGDDVNPKDPAEELV